MTELQGVKFPYEPATTAVNYMPEIAISDGPTRKWPPTSTERLDARLDSIEARLRDIENKSAGIAGAVARLDRESRDALAALTHHSRAVATIEGLTDALFRMAAEIEALKDKVTELSKHQANERASVAADTRSSGKL